MGRLEKNDNLLPRFIPKINHLDEKLVEQSVSKLFEKRSQLFYLIAKLSESSVLKPEDVHDFNFYVTEYIFWSQFMFCDSLKGSCEVVEQKIKEDTLALSYLTSAIQYVPGSKETIGHIVSRLSDRFDLEDHLLQSAF
jgi:hypothetical protein